MNRWRVVLTKQAKTDLKKAQASHLRRKVEMLRQLLAEDPLRPSADLEVLRGDLHGVYSRRINLQHRLVYQVLHEQRAVKVLRMWTHYE